MKKTILKRGLFAFCVALIVLILIFISSGINVNSQGDTTPKTIETIEPTPTPYGLVLVNQQFKYVNTEDKLNVRGGTNNTAEVWDTLSYGAKVLASSEIINGYCLIIYTKGETDYSGYVYAEYLTEQEITPEMIKEKESSKQPSASSGNLTFLGNYYITGYDTCASCCGKSDGITASGARATVGRTVAMKGVPFGTQIYIEGIGYRVVEDRGVGAGKVDVLCGNHSECYAITGTYKVYIVNFFDL